MNFHFERLRDIDDTGAVVPTLSNLAPDQKALDK